jgi:membrane glycosyltransferase
MRGKMLRRLTDRNALATAGPIRRLIALLLYLAMISVGTIYSAAFVMHGGGRSIGLAAAVFMAVFSAYLLWQDFLAA